MNKANATIQVTPYIVTYDSNPHTATGTATGVGGVSLSSELNLSGTTHTAVGTYTDGWTFTDATGNYNNASGTITDIINQPPPTLTDADLVVSASGQKTAVSGRDVIYQINVTNYGPGSAQSVVVTDTLPAGTTFVSATSSTAMRRWRRSTRTGPPVTIYSSAPMGVGASAETIVIDATVNSNVASGATLTNNVTVTTPTAQAANARPLARGLRQFHDPGQRERGLVGAQYANSRNDGPGNHRRARLPQYDHGLALGLQ